MQSGLLERPTELRYEVLVVFLARELARLQGLLPATVAKLPEIRAKLVAQFHQLAAFLDEPLDVGLRGRELALEVSDKCICDHPLGCQPCLQAAALLCVELSELSFELSYPLTLDLDRVVRVLQFGLAQRQLRADLAECGDDGLRIAMVIR